MKTPRVSLRITAYQSVLASRSPRTGCQGGGGGSNGVASPVSTSRASVAT